MAYTRQEFWMKRFSPLELSARWDRTVEGSPHFGQPAASPTDRYRRRIMRRLLGRWAGHLKEGDAALKLDLYNEATGTHQLEFLEERGVRITGIDISSRVALTAAGKMNRRVQAVIGDIRYLPFEDAQFDLVLSLGTLEHAREQSEALDEIFRVLKPGGTAVVGVNNLLDLWLAPLMWKLIEWSGTIRSYWSYEPSFTPGYLRGAVARAGFREIEVDGYSLFPKWLRALDLWCETSPSRWAGRLKIPAAALFGPWIAATERLEASGWLNYFADSTMVKGRKPI